MVFLKPLAILETRTSKLLCNSAPVKDFAVSLRALELVDPDHRFYRTTYTPGYFTPEIPAPDPEISEIWPGFELELFRIVLLGSGISQSPFWLSRTGRSEGTVWIRKKEVARCCKRTRPRPSFKGVTSVPMPPLPGEVAGSGRCSSKCIHFSFREIFTSSPVYCVGSGQCQNSLQRACNSATSCFGPFQMLRGS